jgi:hypothetical protein
VFILIEKIIARTNLVIPVVHGEIPVVKRVSGKLDPAGSDDTDPGG